jgi:hypothetical protein
MKLLRVFSFTIFMASALTAGAQPEAEHPAAKAAKAYIERLKSGGASDTVSELWDLDTLLSSSFGLGYLELTPAEKTTTKRAFANFLGATFANPQIAHLFSTITIKSTKLNSLSDSLVGVTMELTGDDGKFNGVNTLLLSKVGDNWRIIDQRQGTSMPVRCSIVVMWAGERTRANATIAAVLENAAAQMQRKAGQEH